RQLANDRDDRCNGLFAVRKLEARMERGQLDRNTRGLAEAALRRIGNAIERTAIGVGVALGVLESLGSLAEHVEAVAEALLLFRLGALQRFADGAAKHEIPAKDLHRLTHGCTDDWLPETADGT